MTTPAFSFLTLAALLLVLLGCGSGDEATGPSGSSSITLTLNGLEPLSGGLNYQAWAVVGTEANPWGYPLVLFNIDEEGQMVDPVADTLVSGPFHAALEPSSIRGFGISLEVTEKLLSYSSSTFILGGELLQGVAELSTEPWPAFGLSLVTAGGEFILSTPTDSDPENELSGIWFLDPSASPATPGLNLPEAPIGWEYEAWVVLDDQPLSMGKFLDPAGPDSDNPYSGSSAAPPLPGEDFLTGAPAGITFPLDLSGRTVLVTLEPRGDWDVEPEVPFFLRILEGEVPAEGAPQTLYSLTSLTDQLPTGTATVQ
jgi:hypothetical protein